VFLGSVGARDAGDAKAVLDALVLATGMLHGWSEGFVDDVDAVWSLCRRHRSCFWCYGGAVVAGDVGSVRAELLLLSWKLSRRSRSFIDTV
jgi:hypothetical protein